MLDASRYRDWVIAEILGQRMTNVRTILKRTVCFSAVGYLALIVGAPDDVHAQNSNLPPVTVDAPTQQQLRRTAQRRNAARTRAPARRVAAPAQATPADTANRGPVGERANGPVVGVLATQSGTSTKTDTPILTTPQSISVIPKDQIYQQGAQSVNEALRYTPGITLDTYGATTFYDAFKLRGFDAPRYLDGLRLPIDPGTQFAFPRVDPYMLERIEVLKGPSSGLYGATDPGGFLNMISKRPTDYHRGEVIGTFGSFNTFQGAVDVSGPLDKNKEFLYRIVGLARDADGQQDFVHQNRYLIAPSFTWRPTNDTSLTILSHLQRTENKGWQQYVPGPVSLLPWTRGRIPYSRYIGEPSVDGYRLDQGAIGYAFEHRFDNNLQFRSNFRYTDVSNKLTGVRTENIPDFSLFPAFVPVTVNGMFPGTNLAGRSINYVNSSVKNLTADNHLQADFITGPFQHKVLAGIDYQRQDGDSDYRFSFINPIDVYNPVYGAGPIPAAATLPPSIRLDSNLNQTGLYLQDQIKLDRWSLTLTGRHDWANVRNVSTGGFPLPGTYTSNDKAFTGRVGLSYLFDSGLAPYVSYSTSFQPISGVSSAGAALKPTTGEGKEIGVKFKPAGMNLMFTAAVYEIVQQNVVTADPANINLSIQAGEVRSRGIELEARGNLSREFEIIGGYSHVEPEVTKDTFFRGKTLPYVALDTVSLWGKYTWYDGPVAGLGIGAGIRYVGTQFGDSANSFVVPSYTLFDAAISYDFAYLRPDMKGWSAQVTATNLTNRYYVSGCATSQVYCGLGAARTVLGTLRYAWN